MYVIKITSLVLVLGQAGTFDVASIKRTAPDVRISEFQMRQGGRLFVLGMTLRDLIRRSYGPDGIVRNEQVVGGPAWGDTDRFDIEAGSDAPIPDDVRTPRMLAMLRSLLDDRFRLKVHLENRETDMFSLLSSREPTRWAVRYAHRRSIVRRRCRARLAFTPIRPDGAA